MNDRAISTTVTVRRSPTRVGYFDSSLPEDLLDMLWTRPETIVPLGDPLQMNKWRRTVRLKWGSTNYVLKHYVEGSWRHALKRSFQHSRAWSTWSVTKRLLEGGVATPRAVACVENRLGPLRRDSFLMYRYVEGRTLRTFFTNRADNARIEGFWQQLRDLWRQFAELRVSLTDTHLRNFIVCPAGRIWVIDLDQTRFHRSGFIAARRQLRDWNRLLRSVTTAEKRKP